MDLARASYISLVTFRRDGRQVATPVWFAARDGRLYAFTAANSGKVKRLRQSSRARLAPCNARGQVRGEWREVIARVVDDAETERRAFEALRAKYGVQMRVADFLSRLSGRIHQRSVLEIEI